MYACIVMYYIAIQMVIMQGRWSGWLCEICGIFSDCRRVELRKV